MDRTTTFRKAGLFSGLEEGVVKALASRAIEKRLERNEILFIAGQPATGLYLVAEGAVRAFRSAPDGREQVIHVEHAITTIAEVPVFDGGSFPSTVAAETPATLYFIPKEDVMKICSAHPEVAIAAAKLLASRLRKCAELVETLSLREVGQRVAMQFLNEASTHGTKSGSELAFPQRQTHSQMAASIGTVREVVTRAIHRLELAGLVKVEGRTIRIPDRTALRRYAGYIDDTD